MNYFLLLLSFLLYVYTKEAEAGGEEDKKSEEGKDEEKEEGKDKESGKMIMCEDKCLKQETHVADEGKCPPPKAEKVQVECKPVDKPKDDENAEEEKPKEEEGGEEGGKDSKLKASGLRDTLKATPLI